MTVVLSEKFRSGGVSFSGIQTQTYLYDCLGDDDINNVLATLQTETAVTYTTTSGTMRRKSIDPGEHKGPLVWEATVIYEQVVPDELSAGDGASFAFEIGGGTAHITTSLAVVNTYGAMIDSKQGIGATAESIEGCDIFVPSYNFTETWRWDPAVITGLYKAKIFALCAAPVNDAPFRDFSAGEVLFTGASGSKTGPNEWEITYKFSALPNATGLVRGDITGIDKKGWDYMDVRFVPAKDPTVKKMIQIPESVVIQQVYRYGDFSTLGIGVT